MKRLIDYIKNKIFYLRIKLGIFRPIHYIGGPETLPAPLTNEQEAELFSRFDADWENVKEKLITHSLHSQEI